MSMSWPSNLFRYVPNRLLQQKMSNNHIVIPAYFSNTFAKNMWSHNRGPKTAPKKSWFWPGCLELPGRKGWHANCGPSHVVNTSCAQTLHKKCYWTSCGCFHDWDFLDWDLSSWNVTFVVWLVWLFCPLLFLKGFGVELFYSINLASPPECEPQCFPMFSHFL